MPRLLLSAALLLLAATALAAKNETAPPAKNETAPATAGGLRARWFLGEGEAAAGGAGAKAKAVWSGDVERVGGQPRPADDNAYAAGAGSFPPVFYGKKAQAVYQGYTVLTPGAASVAWQWRLECGGMSDAGGYCYADVGGEVLQGAKGEVGAVRRMPAGEVPVYVSVIRNAAGDSDFVTLERRAKGVGMWVEVLPTAWLFEPAAYPPVANEGAVGADMALSLNGTGFSAAGLGVSVDGVPCAKVRAVGDSRLTCGLKPGSHGKVKVVVSTVVGASNALNVTVA